MKENCKTNVVQIVRVLSYLEISRASKINRQIYYDKREIFKISLGILKVSKTKGKIHVM